MAGVTARAACQIKHGSPWRNAPGEAYDPGRGRQCRRSRHQGTPSLRTANRPVSKVSSSKYYGSRDWSPYLDRHAMILFDLKCPKHHVFEAWFPDSDAFDSQVAGRRVSCPVCGSRRIEKAPMAPRIGKGEPAPPPAAPPQMAAMRQVLRQLRKQVEENCDYVGGRFPEEARRIHY